MQTMPNVWGNQPKKKGAKNLVESLSVAEDKVDLAQVEEKQKGLEERYEKKVLFQIDRVQKQEKEVYSRDKREAEMEIEALRQEVKLLAKHTTGLEKTLAVAAEQNIVSPNIYDVNFLKRLATLIKQFRQKIDDAAIWLETWNQKGKKRGFFWGTFASKKGGAQFYLSNESYSARSAG